MLFKRLKKSLKQRKALPIFSLLEVKLSEKEEETIIDSRIILYGEFNSMES
jgi:hypothetical protein